MASYLKIDPKKHIILVINAQKQEKFVMLGQDEITAEAITEFVNDWANGEATKFGLTDEVKEV